LEGDEWRARAHVRFIQKTHNAGIWGKFKDIPEVWKLNYPLGGSELVFKLALTSFKHIGIFPEHALNWDFIYRSVKKMPIESPRVLNLFAYTGGASMAARLAGAEVTHLDALKQAVNRARENMEFAGLDGIKWLVEDALTFLIREKRRGNTYHGIIMDPPAFGRGPDGEQWKFDTGIEELVQTALSVLEPENHFLILNTYSRNTSLHLINNLLVSNNIVSKISSGEMFIQSKSGIKLPVGIYARTISIK
jgi:23S rRNA (cytosine1962-C5)-methyltransferase